MSNPAPLSAQLVCVGRYYYFYILVYLYAVTHLFASQEVYFMNFFPKVDNPVSLLNQDTSRHLLQSKDESDLYKVQ